MHRILVRSLRSTCMQRLILVGLNEEDVAIFAMVETSPRANSVDISSEAFDSRSAWMSVDKQGKDGLHEE